MKIRNLMIRITLAAMVLCNGSYGQAIKFNNNLFSTAGFHKLDNSNSRLVYSFNNGWYFYKGDVKNADKANYKITSRWKQVTLPHGVDILPADANGGINYQGIVWYRKTFTLPKELSGKLISLTFEAIMGKCKIWLNGKLVAQHKGGYLPVVINAANNDLNYNSENVIAVMADNSDDPQYAPGKAQYVLDFNYYGGIYRDAWLVATNNIYISDANAANKVAGGGVLVHYEDVSGQAAKVVVQTDVVNESNADSKLTIETDLRDTTGKIVAEQTHSLLIAAKGSNSTIQTLQVSKPRLWSPDDPNLYRLYTLVKNAAGEIIDGYYQNIGIRSVEFRENAKLYLNGKPFNDKLVGGNHHQDYALIGNAVSNNLHWHDAKVMRDAGIRIVRGSHYPQDPAFMDACDQLGIFVIVCTPGWQFWNKDTTFANSIYSDVRHMIRRDRNHPSVFAWESIPNETGYPADFGQKVYEITHAEFPFKDCIATTNSHSPHADQYELLYGHPGEQVEDEKTLADNKDSKSDKMNIMRRELQKPFFTREWGDNVDNWNAQNADGRVERGWGEVPQLVQAKHYANPDPADRIGKYATSWETLYESPAGHIGGCVWPFADTERGYHPDPQYGGLVDIFRQTKYAYYLFKSQQNPDSRYFALTGENPYTLYIANEFTPFSPADVTVFTNCDSVRLTVFGKYTATLVPDKTLKMPHPPIVFKDAYHFRDSKDVESRKTEVVATGFKNGKVVIVTSKKPGLRPAALKLSTDAVPEEIIADGSTVIPITASILDNNGTVKRLNDQLVTFEVVGEGRLINNSDIAENPKKMSWGTAPLLLRTNMKAGDIKVIVKPIVQGAITVRPDTLVLHSLPPSVPAIYNPKDVNNLEKYGNNTPIIKSSAPRPLGPVNLKEQLRKVEEGQKKFQTNN
ncbi:MAG: glycoside hydrolase family 2 TIM barrel-domain containing protein [Mucilaginibacter sp.]|uniref:glycoside hydrolase family 2 TIM barrel-domain containing protein n=1 Tax=Mucilaginibacter sp. TaxID=1882438 RepID=UPI0034E57D12